MNGAVLVTGAAGFIGSHLSERLVSQGHEVVGLDNFDDYYSPALKWDNVRGLRGVSGFRLVQGDIRDAALLNNVFSDHNITAVVHLAALAGVRPSLTQPCLYQEVNVGGTINLLEASRASHIRRFVFASSSSVYGANCNGPFHEDMRVDYPASPYAASKTAAELFCRTYNHLYGLDVAVLRLFTVYGPRQRPEMAISLFTRMVDSGEEVPIFGDGTSERDYTYVGDIIDGIMLALSYQGGGFEIFNLGSSHPVAIVHLVHVIEVSLGKKAQIKNLPVQPGDVPATLAQISKAQAILGYQPKVEIQEGVPLFIEWYRESRERRPEPTAKIG